MRGGGQARQEGAVLGLDTSCYTTSVAAVGLGGAILASCRKALDVPAHSRGLQQSQAGFFHVRALPALLETLRGAVPEAGIRAVCASTKPRNASDSYMPVFGVGESQGRSLAAVLGVPFFDTDHQTGHLHAALVGTELEMDRDFLALHLSGGTTELLQKRTGEVRCLGGTADISAGQLVDRTGVALGLPFPCGAALERLARQGEAAQRLGVSIESGHGNEPLRCHFSGAEAQAVRWIESGELRPQDIAAEVYALLARTVARMIEWGVEHTGSTDVLLAGGVASSALLGELLARRMERIRARPKLHFAKPELAGDNAVGVALAGLEQLKKQHDSIR
ncbi:MAG: O-sialoglycoprotein endopeptidase [Clostridia bacterium]|nr:O-sialoglycoprotein endopeptidase [Clostridia bacterium]